METSSQYEVLNVPIEDIIPNRFQPRITFDESSLQELASSIKEHGIIQPLVLRRLNDKYEIIAGERRYKAAKMAGLASVPAIISSMNDKESAEVAIVENVQRKDLSPIEEAKSYKALLDKGYLTQDELARKMGLSQSAISNKMRLLALSPKVQDALAEEKISERHARSLLKIEDQAEQDKWLDTIINERLTVRALDNRLSNYKKEGYEETKTAPLAPLVQEAEPVKEPESVTSSTPQVEQVQELEVVPTPPTESITVTESLTPEVVLEERKEDENMNNEEIPNIPNKFFNFLEDEEANMSVVENDNNDSFSTDEVEMLDIGDTPQSVDNINLFEEASEMVDKLVTDLKNKNYRVSILKDEGSKEAKYTITVDNQ